MQLVCAEALASIVRAGVVEFDGVQVGQRSDAMRAAIARAEEMLRTSGDANPITTAVRAMYHRLGIDPTRTRPSSEALLRRVRKGDALPSINNVVDVGNWCSVETQLPFGLYDTGRIHGPVSLRRGREGEAYAGIRKDIVHVAGRMTLADDEGAFGNPTSDSARTMVTGETARVTFVVYAPAACEVEVLTHALDLTAARMREFVGASETSRVVAVPGNAGDRV